MLVEPKSTSDIPLIKKQVEALGYRARTKEEFMQNTEDFFLYKTGGGTNMLIMMLISFIVGLSLSGQTFYTFILENLERFGALKAIGAKSRDLVVMILFQAAFTAFTGFGLGIALCVLLIMPRQGKASQLRRHDYLRQPGDFLWHGSGDCRGLQLFRGPAGSQNRALRYFPRMRCRK